MTTFRKAVDSVQSRIEYCDRMNEAASRQDIDLDMQIVFKRHGMREVEAWIYERYLDDFYEAVMEADQHRERP